MHTTPNQLAKESVVKVPKYGIPRKGGIILRKGAQKHILDNQGSELRFVVTEKQAKVGQDFRPLFIKVFKKTEDNAALLKEIENIFTNTKEGKYVADGTIRKKDTQKIDLDVEFPPEGKNIKIQLKPTDEKKAYPRCPQSDTERDEISRLVRKKVTQKLVGAIMRMENEKGRKC